MKSTTRGTLAAVITGVAAAVGAAATPAAAAISVPVPLDGLSMALGTEVPKASLEVPVLMAGAPDGPRYVAGRLMPEHTLPQVPFTGNLPGAHLRTPLPRVLGDGSDHAGVDAPGTDLRTLAPGVNLDAPLTPPNPDNFGMPNLKLPEAAVAAPVLQAVPGLVLSSGPGL
ncbi:hypothetical protein [Streptomyces sp. MMG1121]|uniref:hypothetical protein n=1 Tax=Streptomyces sp. MMG1121 TaxID=1415544 RepID=UPI0006ADBC33|nr:hypothetical protein [Streptomyces sp. MMG1121]KOV58317.1 hypothetical protein ADK64_36360 [Streptomyces sp. MMG1121]